MMGCRPRVPASTLWAVVAAVALGGGGFFGVPLPGWVPSEAVPRGGKCETSADCVAPNVCSKWGWCQWTKIYGEAGPSQGAEAPGGGRGGQCRSSADCAPRVPFCSDLGFCHGGTLPFDEAQLDIDPAVKAADPDQRSFGYVNNDPAKNSPVFAGTAPSDQAAAPGAPDTLLRATGPPRSKQELQSIGSGPADPPADSGCPEGSLQDCIDEACVPLQPKAAYIACVTVCGKRCPD